MKYVCQADCYFAGRLWVEGEEYTGKDTPPKHFVPEAGFVPPEPVGEDISKPMTLKEAQTKIRPKKGMPKGEEAVSLAEAKDLF
jgi:hypothetical protein